MPFAKSDYIADTLIVAAPLAVFDSGDMLYLSDLINRSTRVILLLDGLRRSTTSHLHSLTPHQRQEALGLLFPVEVANGRLIIIPVESNPYKVNTTRQKNLALIYDALTQRECSIEPSTIRIITARKTDIARSNKLIAEFEQIKINHVLIDEALPNLFERFNDPSCTPPLLRSWIEKVRHTPDFSRLTAEYTYCQAQKAKWAGSPYPPTFVTADIVVRWGGKTLLAKRGDNPALGLIVVPGGHLEALENLFETALREANEETGLATDNLLEYFAGTKVFDDPDRDPRGRYITHAHYFHVPGDPPPVQGADDVAEAFWRWPSEFKQEEYGFDHWHIVTDTP